jgi:hypothetical protein
MSPAELQDEAMQAAQFGQVFKVELAFTAERD